MPHTFVRFVVHEIDPGSGRRRGIFHAAGDLVDANILGVEDLRRLLALRAWFNQHLEKPDRFAGGRKKNAAHVAISWFKSSASGHVTRMQEMCRILKNNGTMTDMITSARPGYIVYEDEHQVAAIPFADTLT